MFFMEVSHDLAAVAILPLGPLSHSRALLPRRLEALANLDHVCESLLLSRLRFAYV